MSKLTRHEMASCNHLLALTRSSAKKSYFIGLFHFLGTFLGTFVPGSVPSMHEWLNDIVQFLNDYSKQVEITRNRSKLLETGRNYSKQRKRLSGSITQSTCGSHRHYLPLFLNCTTKKRPQWWKTLRYFALDKQIVLLRETSAYFRTPDTYVWCSLRRV